MCCTGFVHLKFYQSDTETLSFYKDLCLLTALLLKYYGSCFCTDIMCAHAYILNIATKQSAVSLCCDNTSFEIVFMHTLWDICRTSKRTFYLSSSV